MRYNAQKLTILINQLLDLSKIENGKYPLRATRGDLIAFIREISDAYASVALQQKITFDIQLDPCLEDQQFVDHFYFDKDIFGKVINNLLSNAFKFTPPGGIIKLYACLLQSAGINTFLEIVVIDNGPGIPNEKLTFIFDRFYQAENSRRDYEGSGIGLSFVKELTSIHYGKILVKSHHQKGTVFILRFPLGMQHFKDGEVIESPSLISYPYGQMLNLRPHRQDEENDEGRLNDTKARGPLILVVEDHEDLRMYIKNILASSFRIKEARAAMEGITMARRLIPDLIISDILMPRMDGFEFCRSIKEYESTSHIPFIFLTALSDETARLKGISTKADDYLLKPFHPQELLMRVENMIETRRILRNKFTNRIIDSEAFLNPRDLVFMNKLTHIVENNISKTYFTTTDLGKEIGMSRPQLHRKMNALINQTPHKYIEFVRMNMSKELLEKDAGTVSEIAYKVGYDDPGYFSRCFRKFFGCLPSEIRKLNKQP
jgi:CheY-like chemotaxis protein